MIQFVFCISYIHMYFVLTGIVERLLKMNSTVFVLLFCFDVHTFSDFGLLMSKERLKGKKKIERLKGTVGCLNSLSFDVIIFSITGWSK